jgi:ABC-type Fe3+/spermidine/putrescine transport system ATPase subunit
MPHIKIKGVSKYFGSIKAVHAVDLEIKDGEYVVLLGPSGCGKTTLLKMIAGIITPTSGKIEIGGKDVTMVPPEDRGVGFVFQNYALFPHMSALDNASYGPISRGMAQAKARRIASEMLGLVHLEDRADAFPREMSGGMQQRLALARAFATGSKLILLDEPTNALDAYLRAELRVELRRMAKKLGFTAIHVTHDQEEAMALADKIVIMRKGMVQQWGDPQEVYSRPSTPFVANFLGEANFIRATFEDNCATVLGKEIKAKAAGERIAMIRPENLDLGSQGTKARVVGSRMLGPYYKYDVDCNGLRLSVRTRKDRHSATKISFNPKNVVLLEEPEEGLERSLLIE